MKKTKLNRWKEFFAENYKDEVFRILETYPDERTIIIDYFQLEVFDPDLADLMVDVPEPLMELAKVAIKDIDPLAKDANLNIRFENVTNCIPLQKLNSNIIGQFVVLNDVIITDITKPKPVLDIAVYECCGCMRLQEVQQHSSDVLLEPSLCGECGGRTFKLLQEESTYQDKQVITVGNGDTSRKMIIVLYDDECSFDNYHVGDHIRVTGILKTFRVNDEFETYVDCNYIEQLSEKEPIQELDSEARNTPEYRMWQKEITDGQVCACCGGHKHLHAHHIFGFKDNPEYRLDPKNGVALCKWCHGKYHSYYPGEATPKNLIEFIRRFGVGPHE